MPLVKYYSFNGSSGTCYDGQSAFACSPDSKRFYPDEYLIAHILNKYLSSQATRVSASSKKIILLTEKWLGNGGTRAGGKNTDSLNTQIFEAIKEVKSDSEAGNTLILVPFLYGYHHPGVAIDIRNKKMVYLDPQGVPASRYPETAALERRAKAEGFDFQNVVIAQQRDGSSCGPILTLSMIKFIEEFLKHGEINKKNFEAPRKNLATDRLFQMYVNHSQEAKEEKSALDEIMLADESLWQSVFSEQGLETLFEKEILALVSAQKAYIYSLKGVVGDSFTLKKIHSIRVFQARLTEFIFINPPDLQTKMKILLAEGRSALAARETDESSFNSSLTPLPLLERSNQDCVYKKLRLDAFVSRESLPLLDKRTETTGQLGERKGTVPSLSLPRSSLVPSASRLSTAEFESKGSLATPVPRALPRLTTAQTLSTLRVCQKPTFASFFPGCEEQILEMFKKARIYFEFKKGDLYYLDFDPDLAALYNEAHFDFCGQNILAKIKNLLSRDSFAAVRITNAFGEPLQLKGLFRFRLPAAPQDPSVHYIFNCIAAALSQTPLPRAVRPSHERKGEDGPSSPSAPCSLEPETRPQSSRLARTCYRGSPLSSAERSVTFASFFPDSDWDGHEEFKNARVYFKFKSGESNYLNLNPDLAALYNKAHFDCRGKNSLEKIENLLKTDSLAAVEITDAYGAPFPVQELPRFNLPKAHPNPSINYLFNCIAVAMEPSRLRPVLSSLS